MRAAVRGLQELVPSADLLVTSPYTRAVQTQEIVRAAYGDKLPTETTDTLEPERSPAEFEEWLRSHAGDADVVIAVGHEPQLSTLATWLMTGSEESHIELRKGGACLLLFESRVKRGEGALRWLMGPKELKQVG